MKTFFHNPHRALERKLGYSFRNKLLLQTALMHPSYRFEAAGINADNQRLEFLGDAALGLVASDYLFKNYPDQQEGALTCLRSSLTSGKALAGIGRTIGLGEYISLGKGELKSGGQQRPSNITDALEAVLGAAYLDRGLPAVKKIFAKQFIPLLKNQSGDIWLDNPKGLLQAVGQRHWKSNPHYNLIQQSGPAHSKIFTVRVTVGSSVQGIGQGSTKRAAEQQAANHALEQLDAKLTDLKNYI